MDKDDDDAALARVLSAICETVWPSLPEDAARARAAGREDEAVFLETSGARYGGEVRVRRRVLSFFPPRR